MFDTRITLLADGFQFLEGPVWLSSAIAKNFLPEISGGALLFNDIPISRTHWWADGNVGLLREHTNEANGNTLDGSQQVLACEHKGRQVVRYGPDLKTHTVASHYRGLRLNSPNDLIVDRDGMVIFTDPPYGVTPEARELDYQGVYRVNPVSGKTDLLLDDFDKPNGLAVSPDYRTLYIADTERGHIRAFDLDVAGMPINGRTHCRVERPDGIRVDLAGQVYVAGMKGIEVFGLDGSALASLAMPERPANLAFGDPDGRTLFITARTSLYKVRTTTAGCEFGGMGQ
ncbi:MAG: SMP-30/gluconolactonase/LRE family protein [Gammaproteobacteria bacterium]|nr:SMP-30/gluconolactonase/LRE family protein [Gammaproteobacteria bacterium]